MKFFEKKSSITNNYGIFYWLIIIFCKIRYFLYIIIITSFILVLFFHVEKKKFKSKYYLKNWKLIKKISRIYKKYWKLVCNSTNNTEILEINMLYTKIQYFLLNFNLNLNFPGFSMPQIKNYSINFSQVQLLILVCLSKIGIPMADIINPVFRFMTLFIVDILNNCCTFYHQRVLYFTIFIVIFSPKL